MKTIAFRGLVRRNFPRSPPTRKEFRLPESKIAKEGGPSVLPGPACTLATPPGRGSQRPQTNDEWLHLKFVTY
jgi:hypothetical protein